MKTTITIFVEPKSFAIFIEVITKLEDLPFDNDYTFNPKDLIYSESMISNWRWLNMPIDEYLKLVYRIRTLTI